MGRIYSTDTGRFLGLECDKCYKFVVAGELHSWTKVGQSDEWGYWDIRYYCENCGKGD